MNNYPCFHFLLSVSYKHLIYVLHFLIFLFKGKNICGRKKKRIYLTFEFNGIFENSITNQFKNKQITYKLYQMILASDAFIELKSFVINYNHRHCNAYFMSK